MPQRPQVVSLWNFNKIISVKTLEIKLLQVKIHYYGIHDLNPIRISLFINMMRQCGM